MNKNIIGILICILFIGTCFNIVPIITNTVKADSNNNLIAHWNFDEGSGTIVHDSSGNGYDGTNVGGSWVSGIFGYGLEITDADRVESITSSYDDSITNALTIAAWVKWYGLSSYHRCQIFDGRYSPGLGIMFNIYPPGKLYFSIDSTSTIISISSVPSNGVWTHVAAVFDDASDLLKIFINGQPDGTLTTTDTYTNSGEQPFIGNNHWATSDNDWVPLNGIIDEIRLYNRALDEHEILNLYENPSGFHKAFLFGKISDIGSAGNLITFKSVNLHYINTNPFVYKRYFLGESFRITDDYKGYLSGAFIFALVNTDI